MKLFGKRSTEDSDGDTVERGKSSGAATLNNYALITGGIAIAGLVLAFVLIERLTVSATNSAISEDAANAEIRAFSTYVDGRLATLRDTLRTVTTSPEVTEALVSRDPATLSATRDRLMRLIPWARRLELIPMGQATLDPEGAIPIKFAAKELITRSENAEWIDPEVYATSSGPMLYSAMRVMTGNGRTLGAVLLVVDNGFLSNALGALEPPAGEVTLIQQFGSGQATNILSHGSAAGSTAPTVSSLTNVTHWRINWQPANASHPSMVSLLIAVVLPAIIALGGVAGAVYVGFGRLQRALARDSEVFLDAAGRASRGEASVGASYSLEFTSSLASEVVPMIGSRGGSSMPAPSERRRLADVATGSLADQSKIDRFGGPEDDLEIVEDASADFDGPFEDAAAGDDVVDAAADDDIVDAAATDDDFLGGDVVDAASADSLTSLADLPVEDAAGPAGAGGIPMIEDAAAPPVAAAQPPLPEPVPAVPNVPNLDATTFRSYDVRGLVDAQLTPNFAEALGCAIGSEAVQRGVTMLIVGADARPSSPTLKDALISGLTRTGLQIVDIGEVPTPVLYYAAYAYECRSGVMVTGSHNPSEYNGFKVMLDGVSLADDAIQGLRRRIESGNFVLANTPGSVEQADVRGTYIERVTADVALAQGLKVVVDCGNGVAGAMVPMLLEQMGCEVIPLYCDVDGTFPNHHPDPAKPENLAELCDVVRIVRADVGLAFDGDGDRLGVVSNRGNIVWPDRVMMLLARDVVMRNPGADIVFDVKCSRHLSNLIAEHGGRPIMSQTGHSHIKARIQKTGALLGGEFSGHICFLERWYGFDDALYSAARLLEVLAGETTTSEELFAAFPATYSTPEISIATTDERKFELMERVIQHARFPGGSPSTVDGMRVDFPDGFGLIRPSNTSPMLTLRFEGDSEAALGRIVSLFQAELARIDPSMQFSL